MKVTEVMEALESSSTLVFLDLAWPGSPRRRLHIKLDTDTMLAKQFLLLCTGQHQSGSSYLNTKLLELRNKGGSGEHVLGGDYQNNNGEGGAPLLTHQHGYQYQKSGSAGAVGSWYNPWSSKSTQFFIITRDRTDNGQWVNIFVIFPGYQPKKNQEGPGSVNVRGSRLQRSQQCIYVIH
ncbi:uncharacterized protein [Cherax quadricarinatus]|uniref:uncharacterized protein n=1 Tax=Cherax quadricarinatus TaxID=27406 RepID=UPI0023787AD1|nr:uncharacterized protein LOC128700941 [Cherax quadricarinatus]